MRCVSSLFKARRQGAWGDPFLRIMALQGFEIKAWVRIRPLAYMTSLWLPPYFSKMLPSLRGFSLSIRMQSGGALSY